MKKSGNLVDVCVRKEGRIEEACESGVEEDG